MADGIISIERLLGTRALVGTRIKATPTAKAKPSGEEKKVLLAPTPSCSSKMPWRRRLPHRRAIPSRAWRRSAYRASLTVVVPGCTFERAWSCCG